LGFRPSGVSHETNINQNWCRSARVFRGLCRQYSKVEALSTLLQMCVLTAVFTR
jgi:hypothetical protein